MTQRIKNLPERDRLGPLLGQFRRRAGLTQADAAVLLNCSLSAIGQWEKDWKRPQPWVLDLMGKAYALSEYESFLLFYEAGYAPYNTPPPLMALLRTWSELSPDYHPAATEILKGALEILETWIAHSRSLGVEARRRTVPNVEEMASYWDQFREDRYHRRRIDAKFGVSTSDEGARGG